MSKRNCNNNIWHFPIKIVLILRKYIAVIKIYVCLFIVFDWSRCYCIQTETHVVVCTTRKIVKQNMLSEWVCWSNIRCLMHKPEAATSDTALPCSWAMKPMTEKMTKPENILVPLLTAAMISASLNNKQPYITRSYTIIRVSLLLVLQLCTVDTTYVQLNL